MSIIVPSEGPQTAKIVLIGEAPGSNEVLQRRPFVGLAGRCLEGILAEVGLRREKLYITNVMQTQPPGNNFAKHFYVMDRHKKVPSPELLEGRRRLRQEIMAIRPNVVVPMGNEALLALGLPKGITNWRGSILNTEYGKVIPTIHPAAVVRNWKSRPAVVSDFDRIVRESEFPDVRLRKRDLVICYRFDHAVAELKQLKGAPYVSCDIETESNQITCIGFADRPDRAICIPFWFGGSGSLFSQEQETEIWQHIREILESQTVGKMFHNALYDMEVLERTLGIRTNYLWLDTMAAFHTLYLELEKSLAFLTSIYTDQPWYKYQRKSDSMDVYFRYNALDACVTYECAQELHKELRTMGLDHFYRNYVHALIDPLLKMELKGVRCDKDLKTALKREYSSELIKLETQVHELAGYEVNTNSPKQLCKWLYDELKLPKQTMKDKHTGRVSLTTNEEALSKLAKKTGHKAPDLLLKIRGINKLLGTYINMELDSDGRIRCAYNICGSGDDREYSSGKGTETGRLSSSKTLRGTGTNLQNIPNEGKVRDIFVADEGKILVNADLSQAEARVVAYMAQEYRLIETFEAGGDVHRRNAANIFNKPESEVTPDERYIGKRITHAVNYGMGPRTYAINAGIPVKEAERLINQYFATYPRIRVWHMETKSQLQKSRVLVNPLGRRRMFYNRWNDSLFREAIAFLPQSTVADILNIGLIDLDDTVVRHRMDVNILLQVHDSLLVQCRKEELNACLVVLYSCLTRPVEVKGKMMTIPVDFKYGPSWGNLEKIPKEELASICVP